MQCFSYIPSRNFYISMTITILVVCLFFASPKAAHAKVFSITSYGAVPGTNCCSAINSAIKDAAAAGGSNYVLIPAGTNWVFFGTVVDNSGVPIQGAGVSSTTLTGITGTSQPVINFNNGMGNMSGISGLTLSAQPLTGSNLPNFNINFTGVNVSFNNNNVNTVGVNFNNCANVQVQNCSFSIPGESYTWGDPMILGCKNVTIYNCTFNCIEAGPTIANGSSYVTLSTNVFNNCKYGVYVTDASNVFIGSSTSTANTFNYNTIIGEFYPVAAVFIGTASPNQVYSGFTLGNCSNISVEYNTISVTTECFAGIYAGPAGNPGTVSGLTIIGNTIGYSGSTTPPPINTSEGIAYGMEIVNASNCLISNNVINNIVYAATTPLTPMVVGSAQTVLQGLGGQTNYSGVSIAFINSDTAGSTLNGTNVVPNGIGVVKPQLSGPLGGNTLNGFYEVAILAQSDQGGPLNITNNNMTQTSSFSYNDPIVCISAANSSALPTCSFTGNNYSGTAPSGSCYFYCLQPHSQTYSGQSPNVTYSGNTCPPAMTNYYQP